MKSLSVEQGATTKESKKSGKSLVLDSCTFIAEAGLTSRGASALKHYLYSRGTQLVALQVVAEECESKLALIAKGRKSKVEEQLEWLGRFLGRVSGWQAPSDDSIKERAKVLANAEHLGAIAIPETEMVRERAESRCRAERPPSHLRRELGDCSIWEQCLELLADHDVVFVSGDGDFRGHDRRDELHPQLRAETEEVGAGRNLTFHPSMESLLSELRSEIPSIPNAIVLAFVYNAIAADIQELESNSGCRPMATGDVKQTLLTTDQADVIEIRLEVDDRWESPDGSHVCNFHLRGSCHYSLSDGRLCDLTPSNVRLLTTDPDGSLRAAKGSFVSAAGHLYGGAKPVEPEPTVLA